MSASVAAGVVALFPFLPGATPADWPRWPLAVLDELGRTVAALHAATPTLSVDLPRERFSIPVADELRLHLSDRAVKPDRAAVMDQLERLEQLQSAVRRLPAQYVLSHADLVGDNILVDDDGRISLLDWDEAADAKDGLRRWGSEQWVHLDRTLGLIRGALLESRRIGY